MSGLVLSGAIPPTMFLGGQLSPAAAALEKALQGQTVLVRQQT